jgi:hypothetical protein
MSNLTLTSHYHASSFIICQRTNGTTRFRNFVARIRSIVKFNGKFCSKVDELVSYSRIPRHLNSSMRENN